MYGISIRVFLMLLLAGIAGCNGSSSLDNPSHAASALPPGSACVNPMPAEVRNENVTVDVPQDFDPSVSPGPATTVPFSVLIPQRCPGEVFPLILYSHGFGGSRIKTIIDGDGIIDDDNAKPVLDRGYVEISLDQRGHGDNRPSKGGGYARLVDPNAEVRDGRAILDWAYDHAAEISVQTEPNSGIPKDLRVGAMGASYGGGFSLLIAALDPRIDVIAVDRTWYDLLYSLLPGDAVKSFMRLLGLYVQLDEVVAGDGVTATPILQTAVNQVAPLALNADLVHTRADLAAAISAPTALPRAVSEQELVDFVYTHGMDYFESQQAAGKPWGFGESRAKLRPVPALFTQGQRDLLFNVTEAYWNAQYLGASGADVRVLTHEDGHMNPIANMTRGVWACGQYNAQDAIFAWFDRYLKGVDSAAFRAIPKVCISVLDSGDTTAKPVGVALSQFPVGSLGGTGAVPAAMAALNAAIPLTTGTNGVFVPIVTISGNDKVLAGIPRIGKLTVTAGTGALQTAIAIVGVGIQRGGQTILADQQVTSFVEGEHDSNRGVSHLGEGVLLPGLGERLRDGDRVGLLFFQQHIQYAPVVSPQSLSGLTGLLGNVGVTGLDALTPLFSALTPVTGVLALPNPYNVMATDVELPILIPGTYPGSSWSQ